MRHHALAIAVGYTLAGAVAAQAAPTTYQPGTTAHVRELSARRDNDDRPYRLTGDTRERVRRVEFRDLPMGRGQTHRVPFVVTARE